MIKKSISIHLAVSVSLFITAILMTGGIIISTVIGEKFSEVANEEMRELVLSNQRTVEVFNHELEQSANHFSGLFEEMFPGNFSLDKNSEINIAGRNVPRILSNETDIVGNFTEVDKFAEITGGNATIFVRSGEEFVRVVTSVKKEDGSRAIGTLLSRSSPAYEANISGRPFTGKVILFGRSFITNYTPLKDNRGEIIGIRYIGIDFSASLETIQDSLLHTKIGQRGHLFVMNKMDGKEQGKLVVHPSLQNKNAAKVLGNESQNTMLVNDRGSFEFTSANSDGSQEKWLAQFVSVPELNWVVAAALPLSELNETRDWLLNTMIVLTLLIIAAITIIIFLICQKVVGQPLAEAVEHMEHIARGDYSQEITVTRQDETGKLQASLQRMQKQMKFMISEIIHVASELATAAFQLSEASNQVAKGSSLQSDAATTMSSTIEELTVSIDRLSENAEEAQSLSSTSNNSSVKGASVIQQASQEMQKISSTVMSAAKDIANLGELSGQISSIIQTIQDIADQTNLLALNAAIEAARAGEQGRGFAVVADEVRGLAARTSTSAQEITITIDKIQECTRTSVATMKSGVTQVEFGADLSSQAGNAINDIQAGSQRVMEVFTEISLMLREQAQASIDVAKNVENIAEMAENNSTAVQQVAGSARELLSMASDLKTMVVKFKI